MLSHTMSLSNKKKNFSATLELTAAAGHVVHLQQYLFQALSKSPTDTVVDKGDASAHNFTNFLTTSVLSLESWPPLGKPAHFTQSLKKVFSSLTVSLSHHCKFLSEAGAQEDWTVKSNSLKFYVCKRNNVMHFAIAAFIVGRHFELLCFVAFYAFRIGNPNIKVFTIYFSQIRCLILAILGFIPILHCNNCKRYNVEILYFWIFWPQYHFDDMRNRCRYRGILCRTFGHWQLLPLRRALLGGLRYSYLLTLTWGTLTLRLVGGTFVL